MRLVRNAVAYLAILLLQRASPSKTHVTRVARRPLFHLSASTLLDDGEYSSRLSSLSLVESNKLLTEYALAGNCIQAEAIFNQMAHNNVTADESTYELVVQSWILSKYSLEIKAREAESIFHKLMKAGYIPSIEIAVSLISLLGEINQPEKADHIFDRVSFAGSVCDISIYNALIVAWGRSSVPNAALKAEELLKRIEFAGLDPNYMSYEALLKAWSSSGRKDAAIKCVEVLRKMIDLNLAPKIEAYEVTLDALADSSMTDASDIGMKLLGNLTACAPGFTDKTSDQKPSLYFYENLVAVWLNSGLSDASNAIGRLVLTMEGSFPSQELTRVNIALVISLCNSSSKKSKLIDTTKADERIANMERRGMKVPAGVHALLVDSWCKVGNPQMAEVALDRLAAVLLSNMSPRSSAAQSPVSAKTSKLCALVTPALKITAFAWNQVIAAYGVLKRTDTAEDEEGVLAVREGASALEDEEMFLLYRAKNADRVYAKLLHLSVQIGRERTERTIGELSALAGVRPDRWTYSALVSIWASCGRLDRAEEKLTLMIRNGIRPTTVTYAALLRGWLARYSAATAAAVRSASSTLLTLDPVSDLSGFYFKDSEDRKAERKDFNVEISEAVDSDNLAAIDCSDLKALIDTALFRVKKVFSLLCRLTQNSEEKKDDDESIGIMLGLEDRDGAFYCQDAFNQVVDAGIAPSLEMYKEVLRMLSKDDSSKAARTNSMYGKIENALIPLGSEYGAMSSTADRAVTIFQHLVGVGGYLPDLECYELLVRAFELSSLSLKSSSSRLTQTYPSRALEVAEHMLSTGIIPSRALYESLLRMWVVSRRPDSPRIAESVFRSMVACAYSASAMAKQPASGIQGSDMSESDGQGKPSQSSFLLLLEAWARSPLPSAAMKSEEVVQTMVAAGVPPGPRAFSLLAYVWSKSWRWESSLGPTVLNRTGSRKSTYSSTYDAVDAATGLKEGGHIDAEMGAVYNQEGVEAEAEAAVSDVSEGEMLPALVSIPQGISFTKDIKTIDITDRQQTSMVYRKRGEFVTQTEEILHRCLGVGLTPDVSLRRSLLSVWCRDRPSKGVEALGSIEGGGKEVTSVRKAEDLLARISVISAVKYLHRQGHEVEQPEGGASSLAASMLSWETQETKEALLPHPSVYMQLAAAWSEEGEGEGDYLSEKASAVRRAEQFLARVTSEIDALRWAQNTQGAAAGGSESSMVADTTQAVRSPVMLKGEERAGTAGGMSPSARSEGLYICYNLLLAAHALSSTGTGRCEGAENIYRQMVTHAESEDPTATLTTSFSTLYPSSETFASPHPLAHPVADVVSTNLLVECIRLSGGKNIVDRCEQLWYTDTTDRRADSTHTTSGPTISRANSVNTEKEGAVGIYPNDYTFELMSKIWVENRCKDIAVRSQNLFDRLRVQAETQGVSRQPYFLGVPVLSPSVASYSALVEVWADLDPQRATEIVDRMTECGLAPAYQVYSRLMATWAKRGRRDKCDSVLLRMLSAGYKPDPSSCRLLLSVHASTDLADSAERTEEALQRLLQAGVRMDEHLLVSQLQAWSKSKSPVAANKAEAALAKGLATGVRPTATLFNVLLDTHGKSRQPDSPEKAEGVLRRMNEAGITPQICSYNAAIAAWGRSYRKDAEERSALVFEQALRDGARPNVITFSSLLSALSRSRDKNAPLRADLVFERMNEAGVEADTMAWTILITIWSRSKLPEKENKVQEIFERMLAAGAQPSEVTYTALLSMWGNSRHPKASQRVVEVFQHMRSAGRRLDTVGYSRSQDKNAPYRANEVFEQMLGAGIRADPMAWTILITLWSKSSLPNKEAKVQQIFKRMLASGEQPNAVTYTSLLIMWSKSRLPAAKERILAIYDRIWNEYVRLDGMAFEVLISSLRRACSRSETLKRADALMARLADFEMPPDARAWSCVIDADNSSGPGTQCHVRALRLYRRMTQSGVKPTLEVFNSVLGAIKRSGDLSSPAITEAILAQMALYGMSPPQEFKVAPDE